ncbi:MAG: FAD binding domain-containing protein [Ktedonobacterales bacterium]
MLRLPHFEYRAARTVQEALDWMAEFDVSTSKDPEAQAMLMAGGTDVLPNMKHRLFTPKLLIGLRGITTLRGVAFDDDSTLRLGAGTRLSEIAASPDLGRPYGALAEAAASISTPQLRQMGTLGGNICLDTRCNYYNQSEFWRNAEHFCLKKGADICRVAPNGTGCYAVSSCDTAPALIALGATVRIVSRQGERELPVRDLFDVDGLHPVRLRSDAVLTSVTLPALDDNWRSIYRKHRVRGAFDFPIAGIAVAARFDGDVCTDVRLTLQGVATAPLAVPAAEEKLCNTQWTADLLEEAADVAYQTAHPMDNTAGTIALRRRAIRSLTRQALVALMHPAQM